MVGQNGGAGWGKMAERQVPLRLQPGMNPQYVLLIVSQSTRFKKKIVTDMIQDGMVGRNRDVHLWYQRGEVK